MKIYVFGNSLIKEDSNALLIMPNLQKKFPQIKFVIVDPNENFPPSDEVDLILLDTVKGITEICLLEFSDLAVVEKSPISPHDYDLLLHLLLLKKLKKINSIKIIGLPYGQHDKDMKKKVVEVIKNVTSQNR